MKLFSKSPKKSRSSTTDDPPSRSPSPPKKTPFRSNKGKDENLRPGPASSRNSSSPARAQSFSPNFDPNSHPLNLPPDQLRRLSALSNMSEPVPIEVDVDHDRPNGTPSSPTQPIVPTSPGVSSGNNVNGTTNSMAPTPPPHKSAPTSPIPAPAPTAEDAEAFKTAGNKFYKAKEYKRAIEEYTKGMSCPHRSWVILSNILQRSKLNLRQQPT